MRAARGSMKQDAYAINNRNGETAGISGILFPAKLPQTS
jgi:hypothetical protein